MPTYHPAVASFLIVLAALPVAADHHAPKSVTLEPCELPGVEGEARCGIYEVFENRAAGKGRKIPLRVAVIPATGEKRAPDPVVYFAGGPGASAVGAAGRVVGQFGELRAERDILLVDVRGTGESEPLFCPYQEAERGLEDALESFIPVDKVPACRDALSETHDLRFYTTPILIDDVDEVRAALGYPRVNLVGSSYGTRAALVYLRRHPESVRTVLLEGVAPTDARLPMSFARDAQTALDALFVECAEDEACHAAFPDPAADLAKVLAELEREPRVVDVIDGESGEKRPLRLTRSALVQTLRYMQYRSLESLQIPAFLRAAASGDYEPFSQAALTLTGGLLSSMPDGLYLAVTCTEDVAFIDPEEAARSDAGTYLGDFRTTTQRDACAGWVRGELPQDYLGPVRSEVPVLLVSGERDPVTPARWGEQVAAHLPNSRHVVIPDGAHGFFGLRGIECLDALSVEFIRGGGFEGLDPDGCVASIERPPFLLEAAAPEAVELSAEELSRFTGRYAGAGDFAVTVELVEGRLTARIFDDVIRLVPVSAVRFSAKGGPPGSFFEFRVADGSVAGLELTRAGATVAELERRD